jgi:predicted ATPase
LRSNLEPDPFMSRKPEAVVTRLRASNFRSIESIDLELGRLNVFVGQNGVGKSNIIDVLRFVRDCLTRGVDQALLDRGGMGAVRRYGAHAIHTAIELQCTFGEHEVEYGFSLESDRRTDYKVREEHLRIRYSVSNELVVDLRLGDGKWTGDTGISEHETPPSAGSDLHLARLWILHVMETSDREILAVRAAFRSLSGMSFYNISPESLRAPQQSISETPFDEKGRNLAAVLGAVKQGNRAELNDIEGALARLVDGLRSYDIHNVGSYLVTKLFYEYPHDATAGGQAPVTRLASDLAQESDGTLRILSILAALYQQPSRALVVIEEPEINIHPGALGVIADLLQEASLRSQILVTTHNPDLIEHFSPDVLRVVEKNDGVTHVGPVAQDQQEAIRKMLFSTAEIMKMEGLRREAVEA